MFTCTCSKVSALLAPWRAELSTEQAACFCSTTTLALGSRQLSAQGAIVTRLPAIEEMAGMTVLCSDKTGTLTLNQMVIQARALTLKLKP